MMRLREFWTRVATVVALWTVMFVPHIGWADEPDSEATPSAESATPDDPDATQKPQPLAASQDLLVRRYERFEETLRKISDALRKTDPDRSALLLRALGKSKTENIAVEMKGIVQLLQNGQQLGDAVERQAELVSQLHAMLDLLLSEDRAKELAAEKARLERYIKDLNKIISDEKDVRAATERTEDAESLAGRQKRIAEKVAQLGKRIDQDDAARQAKSKQKDSPDSKDESKDPAEEKPGDSKPGEEKPGESKPGESKPGEEKPGESKPGESKPGESKPGESKPGEDQPQDQPQSNEQQPTPGKENIEQARKEMENAIEKLKQKIHKEASDNQDEAVRELTKAKEKLEEILRQLREEERERTLAAMEARFQRMLAMQLLVYDGTLKLDKVPAAQRESRHLDRSKALAQQQDEVAIEANKAVTLLREEGSAVAFPEAVEQMRDDMRLVLGRLDRGDVGSLTQTIENDIISALREMIEALQKEMEKKDQKDKGKPQDQQGEQPDPSLVDQLSELKMLRSLQLRINHRTKVLGAEVEGEQANQPDIIQQLQQLAGRQARIQQAAYDLSTGKNK